MAKRKTTSRTPKKTTARKAAPRKTPTPPKPNTITPYLSVNDAAAALDWYKKVFGGKETERQMGPGGKVMHASVRIGDSDVFLSDIFPHSDTQDPSRVGASVTIHVWSKNIDKYWKNAAENGAKVTMPIDNMFWGDRYGKFVDPFGHAWALNWKAKMSKAEMEAKRVEAMKRMGAPPQG